MTRSTDRQTTRRTSKIRQFSATNFHRASAFAIVCGLAVRGKIGSDVFTGAFAPNGRNERIRNLNGAFRFSSGSLSNPVSPNPVLTDFFSRKPIAIDQAYVAWRPRFASGLRIIAGKFEPTWTRTEMTFDNDLQVEGVSEVFSRDIKNQVRQKCYFQRVATAAFGTRHDLCQKCQRHDQSRRITPQRARSRTFRSATAGQIRAFAENQSDAFHRQSAFCQYRRDQSGTGFRHESAIARDDHDSGNADNSGADRHRSRQYSA